MTIEWVIVSMTTFSVHQRHSHWAEDIGPQGPLLALAAVFLFITTLAVFLYASTL